MMKIMQRGYIAGVTVLVSMVLAIVMAGGSVAAPGDTTRVSVDSFGNQAEEGPQGSYEASISSDGRHVAFSSYASDLVEGDTNAKSDIFVHDRTTATTERVSVSSSGTQGNGFSSSASISSDGRYVAFISEAQNLVSGDIGYRDVFVRDRDTDADGIFDEPGSVSTEKVTNTGGADPNQAPPSISSDGRYVAFTSDASDVVEGDTNNDFDVFVHDRTTATTERVSVGLDLYGSGTDAYGGSDDATISSDGNYVVFRSSAPNLIEDDFNGESDIFVRDLQANTTQLVSIDNSGNQANDFSVYPSISADGRYVAFGSYASNLVAEDTNEQPDVFVHDMFTGTTQRVNVSPCGSQANSGAYGHPSISPDGGYVVFSSGFPNLAGGTFVRDLQKGTTQRVSGGGNPSLSDNALHVAFSSDSSILVGDDTNGQSDIFVHERQTETTRPSECIAPTTTARGTTSSGTLYDQDKWTNKDVKVTFSAQDNLGGSGLKDIRYSASGAQSMPLTVYDPQNPPVINTDGHTTMSYFATDNAGNMEPPKIFSVMLDKSAPDTQIVSGPPDFVSSTSASFFLSKDASEDGWMVSFECRLDGGAFATCPQSKSYSSLSQGKHTFEARTVDKAGNVDASPASQTWFVDTTVPRGTISINSGRASTSSRSVTLGLSASDPSPASGVASMRFRSENTTTWSEWVSFSTNVPWTLSTGAGTKTVYAQFKDRAGNVSATKYDRIKYSP